MARFKSLFLQDVIHQRFTFESRRCFKRAANAIPQREVLAVVVIVIQMVIGVVCRAIDERSENGRYPVVTVVDTDGPHVHQEEQHQVHVFIEREHERVEVVRDALKEPVYWVEGVADERGGDLPDVVHLVDASVEKAMVHGSMDPVNGAIGEEDKTNDVSDI